MRAKFLFVIVMPFTVATIAACGGDADPKLKIGSKVETRAVPQVAEFCYDGVVYLIVDRGVTAKINKDRQGAFSTYVNCQ
jgi:hypothetical protein